MTTPIVNSISMITSSVMAALFTALRRFPFYERTSACYWTVVCEAATTGAAATDVDGGAAGAGATVVLATGVAACCCGITSRWPYWTFFASVMLFALRRSSVLIPYFLAMVAGRSEEHTSELQSL